MIAMHTIFLRLAVAVIFGSFVGLERGRTERRAGFRTHALVCLGSALFMIVSQFGFQDVQGRPEVVLDPSRVAAQVVSGIGFLGAGTIIFWREKVRGLTTAASIWSTAAIGLAVGGGLYIPALLATIAALVILSVFKPIEKRLSGRQQILTFTVDTKDVSLADLEARVSAMGIVAERIVIRPSELKEQNLLELHLKRGSEKVALPELEKLRQITGVESIASDTKTVQAETESLPMEDINENSSELAEEDTLDDSG